MKNQVTNPEFLTLSEADLTGAPQALAAGLPDPTMLARLANEFFQGSSSISSPISSLPSVPQVAPDAAAASFASRQPPTLPASTSGTGGLLPPAAPMGATSILLPTAAPSPIPTSPTTASSFSASSIPTSPNGVEQGAVAVTEADVRSIAHDVSGGASHGLLPNVAPNVAPNALSNSAPNALPTGVPSGLPSGTANTLPSGLPDTIPGGVSAEHFSAAPSFGFLSDLRSPFEPRIPTETDARSAAPAASGIATPSIHAPQIPSSVPRQSDAASLNTASGLVFVDNARVLTPLENTPSGNVLSGFVPSLAPFDPLGASSHVPSADELSSASFDVNAVRRDFPILQERVHSGKQVIWLDNAATTQKPRHVIDRVSYFYEHENSNVHRAAHTLAARATDAYDAARDKVRRFLNASSSREIIFVRGTTEAINLVAQSWGRQNIQRDDEIVVTHLEHHANIVPWQMLCAEKGARLRVAPVDDRGEVLLDEYQKLLNSKTKLVAFTHVSNALGTVTPVQEMVAMAHKHGAKVLVDGAQSVSHFRVDVQLYDCDFFVFSGHKLFAPTGIGVVYGKEEVLESMPPWQGGGNMIVDVTFERTVYHPPPARFEAGTGSIADAVGLGAAIDYLDRLGMVNIARYEHELLVYGTEALQRIPGLHIIGNAREKASVLSFVLDGFRTEDVGYALNQEGIAVRSGHHCAQPILRRFSLESTVRPSLAFYNTFEEIDTLAAALWRLKGGHGAGLT
jgi:cysteine desulfurase/selenocysteine lyase